MGEKEMKITAALKRNTVITCDFCPNKKLGYVRYPQHCKDYHENVTLVTQNCSVCRRKVLVHVIKHHMKIYHSEVTSQNMIPSIVQNVKVDKNLNSKLDSDVVQSNISKEEQSKTMFRIIFSDRGRKKSYRCLQYRTELSGLFKRYLSSLQMDGRVVTREQVVFRCRQVSLSGMELVGSLHNQTIEVYFL